MSGGFYTPLRLEVAKDYVPAIHTKNRDIGNSVIMVAPDKLKFKKWTAVHGPEADAVNETDVYLPTNPNQAALFLAAKNGHLAVVRVLLEAGFEPSAPAMVVAAMNGHMECVTALLDAGVDVNSMVRGVFLSRMD